MIIASSKADDSWFQEGGRDVRCLMTLLVHLRVLSVRRLRVMSHALRQTWALSTILWSSIVARGRRLITNGWQLRVGRTLSRHTDSLSHLPVDGSFARRATFVPALLVDVCSVALVICLALSLFLLLLRLPLFADLLELFGCSLLTMRLHCDVRVQVVESTVGLLAPIPATLVHALDLLVASAWSLVLLRTWNRYEGVDCRERVSSRRWALYGRDHCWCWRA